MKPNRFRFRAWDKKGRKMLKVSSVSVNYILATTTPYQYSKDSIILMQSTGLLDKNGNEIFEGDILSYTVFDYNDNDTQYVGDVRWLGSEYIIRQIPDTLNNGDYGLNLGWMLNQDSECEIIGNIYENPELLTK